MVSSLFVLLCFFSLRGMACSMVYSFALFNNTNETLLLQSCTSRSQLYLREYSGLYSPLPSLLPMSVKGASLRQRYKGIITAHNTRHHYLSKQARHTHTHTHRERVRERERQRTKRLRLVI